MDRITKEIINRRNGTYTRVLYRTDMTKKLSAASRKEGYTAMKITETTVRVGCNYNHMESVIERKKKGESETTRSNPYEWIIPNKIKKHENGTEYVVLGTVKHCNSKVTYIISKGTETRVSNTLSDNDKELFIASAFNKGDYVPEVISVKKENLIKFNGIA